MVKCVCHCHFDGEMCAFKLPLILSNILARSGEARGSGGTGKTRNGEMRKENEEMKKWRHYCTRNY